MNINEFSIACKLINLKLRGFELPKALPPTLLASLNAVGGTPTLTPTGIGALSPVNSVPSVNSIAAMPPGRPALPPYPVLSQQFAAPSQIPQTMLPQQQPPLIPAMQQPLLNSQAPLIPPVVQQVPVIPPLAAMTQPGIAMQPLMPPTQILPIAPPPVPILPGSLSNAPLIDAVNLTMSASGSEHSIAGVKTSLPAPPTPPSGTQSRSMSITDKAPSIDSPGSAKSVPLQAGVEWAIKGPTKLKYTQLFNTTDRSRSGFLTGAQARNLLVQSKLPQPTLAQIWSLSDMNSDGRLGCEEFVLAMYLCDLVLQGETLPQKLPPELIPPSFRKVTSRHASIVSAGTGSRHGSVSSQGGLSATTSDADIAGSMHLYNQTSFEDKRKENFDKGQAELERRRKVLLDIQRKEQEERERKEREEADKRERARLEAERRQQEELEHQLQIQRELEQQKEEQRKRELEQKEAARKEMEKQRQLEWENQRIADMQQQRQREQEKVLKLKAQNQTYNIELSTLNEKVKELSQKICDTRVDVTGVKSVIDGMRSTRDTQMTEMSTLKARIKEQNAKLVQLSQEKAKMEGRSKSENTVSQEIFSNKQMNINQLKGKLDSTKEAVESKEGDVVAHTEELAGLRSQLKELIDKCEDIYGSYDTQRQQVEELKNNKRNDSLSSAWDTAPAQDAWATETTVAATEAAPPSGNYSRPGYVKYRALYEFTARNADEITFLPGDIVMVPLEQNAEPDWLAGEINGHTGWFPESYVEKAELSPTATEPAEPVTAFEPVSETTTTEIEDPKREIEVDTFNGGAMYYVSCFPYESAEPGDLTFSAGEYITVTKKDGDWWTGTVDSRTGLFPSNYVQEVGADTTYGADAPAAPGTDAYPAAAPNDVKSATPNNYNDDVRNQEEADTEVSEINTQSKSDGVQDTFTRPMSTSSTTSVRCTFGFCFGMYSLSRCFAGLSQAEGRSGPGHCALRSHQQRTVVPSKRATRHDPQENRLRVVGGRAAGSRTPSANRLVPSNLCESNAERTLEWSQHTCLRWKNPNERDHFRYEIKGRRGRRQICITSR